MLSHSSSFPIVLRYRALFLQSVHCILPIVLRYRALFLQSVHCILPISLRYRALFLQSVHCILPIVLRYRALFLQSVHCILPIVLRYRALFLQSVHCILPIVLRYRAHSFQSIHCPSRCAIGHISSTIVINSNVFRSSTLYTSFGPVCSIIVTSIDTNQTSYRAVVAVVERGGLTRSSDNPSTSFSRRYSKYGVLS